MPALTIGMATYNDFDGVYFTLQSLRLFHDLEDTELLVIDNYGDEHTQRFVESWTNARYVLWTEVQGTAAAKNQVFREASGDVVVCCDSHVLFPPGVIARLKQFYRDHPTCDDLVQGPLLYDDLSSLSTNFDPVWRGEMWGTWATDPRGVDPEADVFDIPMQGMGAFACRRSAWPGFNPTFRGFGGEEGYIHEKFRQAGSRTLCVPWFRWLHRFGRPAGVPYRVTREDKFRNYVIGHAELGLDLEPVFKRFSEYLSEESMVAISVEALWGDGTSQGGAEAVPGAQLAPDRERPRRRSRSPKDLPPVSCICPTYGRPHLLEEAIQSFIDQDYAGRKELIVLNDLDDQRLRFDHPEVSIVNVSQRFRTLGEKYNALVALASNDVLFPWDDDDISLPNRLSLSVKRFDPEKGFYKPATAWVWNDGRLDGPESNLFHGQSCWSRDLFDSARGYAAMGLGHDLELEQRFAAIRPGSNSASAITPRDVFYIYRWLGTTSYHGSQFGHNEHGAVGEYVERELRAGRLATGEIDLVPRWRQDYGKLVRDHVARLGPHGGQRPRIRSATR
jgi:glycosyltransferase involved in cell wall biosynthesis